MTNEIVKGIARVETQSQMLVAKDTGYFDTPLPYTEYVGLISQTGTGAPTVTVFENTLSGAIVWTRTSAGLYVGTLAGEFGSGTDSSVVGFIQPAASYAAQIAFRYLDADSVEIKTAVGGSLSDDLLLNNSLMIRVYPIAL